MNFKSKTVGVIITVIAIALMISIAIFIGGPLTRFVSEPERFRAWVDSHGPFSKLAFILMVFFQVVIAIVPGEPFEIPLSPKGRSCHPQCTAVYGAASAWIQVSRPHHGLFTPPGMRFHPSIGRPPCSLRR